MTVSQDENGVLILFSSISKDDLAKKVPVELVSLWPRRLRRRLELLRNSADRGRTFWAEALLRYCLWERGFQPGEVVVDGKVGGKPFLDGAAGVFEFSISHSETLVVLTLAKTPSGVDVEFIAPWKVELDESSKLFMNAGELASFHAIHDPLLKAEYFYSVWTRKESVLKLVGVGLQYDPCAVWTSEDTTTSDRSFGSRWVASGIARLWARDVYFRTKMILDQYIVSLATLRSERVTFRQVDYSELVDFVRSQVELGLSAL